MGVVCACIFITCRKFKNNCSVKDLAKQCCVDKKNLYKAYLLVKENSGDVFPLSNAQVLARKNAETVGFTAEECKKVEKIVEEIEDYKKNESFATVAALGVFLIGELLGKKGFEDNESIFGISLCKIKELYREIFRIRFKFLETLGTQWQIANMSNL